YRQQRREKFQPSHIVCNQKLYIMLI
ncbi:unnamed protein product, partial [Rotaria magnacalcarata]